MEEREKELRKIRAMEEAIAVAPPRKAAKLTSEIVRLKAVLYKKK